MFHSIYVSTQSNAKKKYLLIQYIFFSIQGEICKIKHKGKLQEKVHVQYIRILWPCKNINKSDQLYNI